MRVRFTELNVANHVGNDTLIAYLNESYARFIAEYGLSTDAGMMIVADLAVVYKSQARYPDILNIDVAISDFTTNSCCFYYRITNKETTQEVLRAKTGVVFFDYKQRKPVEVPEKIRSLFE
jgi:YbgC/YbaW family acyl-CoA thioester hydrolase